MTRRFLLLMLAAASLTAACHPVPVFDPGHGKKQGPVDGTIAGYVTTADPLVAVPGRVIVATEVATDVRYTTMTGSNGSYAVKVPKGRYRVDIELLQGEALRERPKETHINNSDIDAQCNFVIVIALAQQ